MNSKIPEMSHSEFWINMDTYAHEFGRVAMSWSNLERSMCTLLEKLAGTSHETAEAIYLPLNADSRKNLLTALTHLNIEDDSLKEIIFSYLKKFDDLRIQRNKYMHSAIAWVDPYEGIVRQYRETQRGKLKKEIEEVPLKQVRRLWFDLENLRNDIIGKVCFNKTFSVEFRRILDSNHSKKDVFFKSKSET